MSMQFCVFSGPIFNYLTCKFLIFSLYMIYSILKLYCDSKNRIS